MDLASDIYTKILTNQELLDEERIFGEFIGLIDSATNTLNSAWVGSSFETDSYDVREITAEHIRQGLVEGDNIVEWLNEFYTQLGVTKEFNTENWSA
jgi:hypothetical protein